MVIHKKIIFIFLAYFCFSCNINPSKNIEEIQGDLTAYVGAKLIDGTPSSAIENSVLIVENGKIIAVLDQDQHPKFPEGAKIVDLKGKFIMPGLINAHGHIGGTEGLQGGKYSKENVIRDLKLNARYGVTTIVSLGGDGIESIDIRNQQNIPSLNKSRLYVAGNIVVGENEADVIEMVDQNAVNEVDFIKIRVDDNLGATKKMPVHIYKAIIDRAHEKNIKVASHLYYLSDAKSLLNNGSDYIAHSIRDQIVDEELISKLIEKDIPYCPTLMREVSTYIYESRPNFFNDSFFHNEVDSSILTELENPERQERIKNSKRLQSYKKALEIAKINLKKLSDRGVKIVMGTDSGPPGRFQGFFEHQELILMQASGLSPEKVIQSATGNSAKALKLKGIGTLEIGNWADFIVLNRDPLKDIVNTNSIFNVYIAGNKIPRK